MLIDQVSVFVRNSPGQLETVMSVLEGGGIDIRALSLADTSDFGILRIIVNNPGEALDVLQKNGVMAKITEVIAVKLDDKPGGLQRVLSVLSGKGISVEYIYAFITRKDQDACVIMRVENNADAVVALKGASIALLPPEDIYGL
ncbi:MAG: hypothetical protein FWH04_03530 [Oscillospiraceae bacterium]|nr:hypothetical protein [Oscillospiraceae bacterium]